jgi:hypothetical protein
VKSSSTLGNSSYTSKLPSEATRPETPPLAFVDRASFPGYRDPDEAEERMYEMSRVRLEPASALSKESSLAAKDQFWEDDLAAFMRKYGCDVGDSAAPAAPAAPVFSFEGKAESEDQSVPQFRNSVLDADLDLNELSRKSVATRPSVVAGGMVDRPDCGTARASIVEGAYLADVAQSADDEVDPEPDEKDDSVPQFRNSILDTEFDASELSRKSLCESANARVSILADDLPRAAPRGSVMFDGIEEEEEEEKPKPAKSGAGRRILAPQNTRKFADEADEEDDEIPVLSNTFDPSAALPKEDKSRSVERSLTGSVAFTNVPTDEDSPKVASGSPRRQARGLKAPSNTKVFTEEDLAPEEDDIPMMGDDVVGTGNLFGQVLDTAEEMDALSAALFAAKESEKEEQAAPRIRQSTLDASLAAHDMQRVSLTGEPARFSVVDEGMEDVGAAVGRASVFQATEGRVAPANTVVLADEEAANLRAALAAEALQHEDLQEKLEQQAAAGDEEAVSGRHPPANTVAGSPKQEDLAGDMSGTALVLKVGSRPSTDPNLAQELHRRLSLEADQALVFTAPQAQQDQSRDLDLGAVTGGSLVEKQADKTWDAGRNPAWPKMQWDLTKEYENDKQLEPLGKYSKNDLEMVAQNAKEKLEKGGQWLSAHSESGAAKRDFFQDLTRQRNKDKGAQAMGPIWVHLATQAKNIANDFDLQELLTTLKMFTSVRYDDYELYMRLLGEIPRYVATASAVQLCMMVCIMARRRLRERNYVDMVASYLLQKIKVTDDHLDPRMLVKTANAFAALECRSNQRFVEHFLRHIEHRIQELDAEMCCKVSPLLVINYMNDSLRRAYLKRASEVQAGFQGSLEECRNLACTEFCLRKEHHSLVSSLPAYVGRYLDKLKQHAAFDRWGTIHILSHHAPNGPKGNSGHDTNRALQQKASTVEGGKKVDVHSSEMHKDVSACLTHLGIEHESGVLCGPYLLDCVAIDMVNPSKRIVYEVNAPHHFYEGTNQLIAEKRVRHRMLGRLGQKLHMINAEDWMKLTSAQKMTFMLQQQQTQQDKNDQTVKPPAIAREGKSARPQIGGGTVPRVPKPPPRIQPPRSYPNRQSAETQ